MRTGGRRRGTAKNSEHDRLWRKPRRPLARRQGRNYRSSAGRAPEAPVLDASGCTTSRREAVAGACSAGLRPGAGREARVSVRSAGRDQRSTAIGITSTLMSTLKVAHQAEEPCPLGDSGHRGHRDDRGELRADEEEVDHVMEARGRCGQISDLSIAQATSQAAMSIASVRDARRRGPARAAGSAGRPPPRVWEQRRHEAEEREAAEHEQPRADEDRVGVTTCRSRGSGRAGVVGRAMQRLQGDADHPQDDGEQAGEEKLRLGA